MHCFLNCVFTVVCIFFQFVGGFALAMVFKRSGAAFRVMKSLMLIPYIIPVTVNAILWKFFLLPMVDLSMKFWLDLELWIMGLNGSNIRGQRCFP
ncbi:MAG: hypothetical protein ACLTTJ_05205 [Blautia sp.]